MKRFSEAVVAKHMRYARKDPHHLLQAAPLQSKKPIRRPARPKFLDLTKKPLRRLTDEDRLRIIYMRWGKLLGFTDEDRTDLARSKLPRTKDIAKKLYLPLATVGWVVSQFERRGFDLDAFSQPSRKFSTIPLDVQEALKSQWLLQAWHMFSLEQRV